tara:strand:- start:894 stop:1205 length:312 start_codon:yes stop_codon:yes gene_type:complete
MKLTLKPLLSSRSMKITEEKITYFFLLNQGFTHNEIEYIKNQTQKESVKFCIKTFSCFDLEREKIKIRKHLQIKKFNKIKDIINDLVDNYPKNLTPSGINNFN